ncbi:MAG: hypothetical protein U0736_26195 [Gemmataceae bacterium]
MGRRRRYSVRSILAQLDECAEDYTFPMLDNGYVHLGAVRLTAFRDEARWAIIIDVVGYNVRTNLPEGIDTSLYTFGNCLRGDPGLTNDDFLFLLSWDGDDADEWGKVPATVTEVRIRGQSVPVPRDPAVYAAKGIQLADGPQSLRGEELLRVLLPEQRQALLATEEELRRRIPADLPRFLSLDEWYHPNLAGGEEVPSDTETFRLLAQALVEGDPNLLRLCQPPNTHWSNWPDGGTL